MSAGRAPWAGSRYTGWKVARSDAPKRRSVPFSRWTSPEEIARAILFLASDQLSFMTGHVLIIRGGEATYRTFCGA